jgi:gliding motility-associated-like protein
VISKPENLSVFWWNGLKWLQLFGKLDTLDQTMFVQAKFFGTYQMRLAERTGGFSFNAAGVTNRFITPNGDGKNDFTVFKFDNPRSSEVSAKIFDSRGRLVIGSLPAGPFLDSLMWDGKVNGQVVPSGVYIYQLECEDQTYTGTVIIIK